jgi:hypothetical protein
MAQAVAVGVGNSFAAEAALWCDLDTATAAHRAYRTLMARFHPDRIRKQTVEPLPA